MGDEELGEDKRYEKSVLKANSLFMGALERNRIIDYNVFSSF